LNGGQDLIPEFNINPSFLSDTLDMLIFDNIF